MALKCKDWTKLSRKQRLQNTRIAKLWEFCKVTENLHFLKKCKGGTKENFSKIAQKVAVPSKTQKYSGANGIIV